MKTPRWYIRCNECGALQRGNAWIPVDQAELDPDLPAAYGHCPDCHDRLIARLRAPLMAKVQSPYALR